MMQEEQTSSDLFKCSNCGRILAAQNRMASISGSIMGDEHTDSYFLCPACDLYTVIRWWDNFTGVESASSSGPLSREQGDARINLIAKCDRSWDKHCRCESHLACFGNSLD